VAATVSNAGPVDDPLSSVGSVLGVGAKSSGARPEASLPIAILSIATWAEPALAGPAAAEAASEAARTILAGRATVIAPGDSRRSHTGDYRGRRDGDHDLPRRPLLRRLHPSGGCGQRRRPSPVRDLGLIT
jgi:hypothetical protein